MLPEISLNILDITENSTKAGARNIYISVCADFKKDRLTVIIKDDGCGMSKEQVKNVTDPFFTTRTTRKVGLGIPFFKEAAEKTGGSFLIESEKNVGTSVKAEFVLSNIDRMPMGELDLTIWQLITQHTEVEFIFNFKIDDNEFSLNTLEFKEILGDIPLNSPDVSKYIKDYLDENIKATLKNKII